MITATDIAKFIIAGFLFVVTASWVTYTLLFILWIINYVIGLSASKNVDKIPYSWNKTKAAIGELLAICIIIASVTMIGYFQRVSMDNVIKSCQTIAWVFSYLYVVNFLYNLVRLNPSSQIIKTLYNIVSIEILSNIPILNKFIKKHCKLDKEKYCDNCGKCLTEIKNLSEES